MPGKVYTAADQSLNVAHISGDYEHYEAARSAFFVLTVPADQLANLLKVDYTGDPANATDAKTGRLGDNGNVAATSLRLNVVKSSVPHFSLETAEYRRGNDVVKFATVPTWDSGSLVIDDVVGIDTKSILMAWQYLAYNPNTRMGGRMKDYKKNCILTEYTQDYEPIRQWKIQGAFITKISEDEFNREQDGKRQITVDLVFDRAVVDFKFAK